MDTLKFIKIKNVKSPCRAHSTDAGIDFFVPEDFNNGNDYFVPPNGSILIEGGIKVRIPEGCALIFFNKSGVASKKNLVLGACVTGETIIQTNKGNFPCHILTKDFCDKNDILVKSFNLNTNVFEFKKCDGFRNVKRSLIYRITFNDGTIIEGDENHFIYDTETKTWKRLKDL